MEEQLSVEREKSEKATLALQQAIEQLAKLTQQCATMSEKATTYEAECTHERSRVEHLEVCLKEESAKSVGIAEALALEKAQRETETGKAQSSYACLQSALQEEQQKAELLKIALNAELANSSALKSELLSKQIQEQEKTLSEVYCQTESDQLVALINSESQTEDQTTLSPSLAITSAMQDSYVNKILCNDTQTENSQTQCAPIPSEEKKDSTLEIEKVKF